jgi:hypothetical protein
MCEKCRSWDPSDAPKIQSSLLVDPETGEPFDEYPSLSDRYFRFYNEIAKRLARILPEKKLGVYAYSVYKTVPVNIDTLHPALAVAVVSFDQELIEQWSHLTDQLHIRPNIWINYLGFAENSAHWLADNVKFAVEQGAQGFDLSSCVWNWGTHGLDYYVVVHTMWDPSVNVDRLIEDYCLAAYGEGAPEMMSYHQRLEEVTTEIREDGLYLHYKKNPEVLAGYYTDELIAELQGYIDTAKSSVQDSSLKSYKRIVIVEEGLEYTRLASNLLTIASATGSDSDPRVQNARNELLEFMISKLPSYSINAGWNYFYYRKALNRLAK